MGGHLPIRVPKPIKLHTGPVPSVVAGRTDHLPLHVPSGSYVLPADCVNFLGDSNTTAGFAHVKRLFGGMPYTGSGSPYGQAHGMYGMMAKGGRAEDGDPVPVVLAGGEYVLSPREVQAVGEGDLDKGHKVLDAFVAEARKRNIATLRKLPGPSKN